MSAQLKQQQNWLVTASLSVLAIVAIGFVLRYTRDVMMPFVVAIFIGSLVSPLMDVMELKWKWRHSVSVVVALIVVLVATTLFGFVLFGAIRTIYNEASDDDGPQSYRAQFVRLSNNIDERVKAFMPAAKEEKLEDSTKDAEESSGSTEGSDERGNVEVPVGAEEREDSPMQTYVLGLIPQFAGWVAGSTVSLFSALTLTLIFVMFVLAGRDPRIVREGVYKDIDTQVRSYITTKVALSLGTGVLVWAIFWGIGMPMAAVFGVVAFLLNFIPSVGSIISTLIPIPFALAIKAHLFAVGATPDMDDIAFLLAVVCLPGCVQMLIGNVLEPKLMGNDLQLHPITILLSLAIWGLLWGPVGMLLAVPMTAIIRIVLMKFEITQIAGKAMAGELPDLDAADKQDAEPATT